MRLLDKIVLVTGASKGIGRALALGMAREGADVALNYNSDRAGAWEAAREIKALGRRAMVVQADIGRVPQIKRMFEKVRREFGRLDVLVNNAAVTAWASLLDTTEKQWDRVVDTNLKGTFFCSIEAARMMRQSGGGAIVNVSTNCAELGVRNLAAYAASKGGVHALTKQLAVELADDKIRVNTFAPGPTDVERNLRDDPNYPNLWHGVVPLGRSARPEEMVGTAVFLASNDSSYMTGQIFFVDGGWTAAGRLPKGYLDRALRKNVPRPRAARRPKR